MRVDWQQSLEGLSLLEIRNILRSLYVSDAAFGVELIAARLPGPARPRTVAKATAQRLIDGLIASDLVRLADKPKRADDRYVLTDTGMSLRAASATRRFKRERADKAVARLLEVVAEINADPIYMHDVASVAVFGSYLTTEPDLGDVDVAVELRARWQRGSRADSDYQRRKRKFEKKHPPPLSFYEKLWWANWAETYTKRRLRVDPGIKLIDRLELDGIKCPYRVIFPTVEDAAAKPGWSFERREVMLRSGAGVSA